MSSLLNAIDRIAASANTIKKVVSTNNGTIVSENAGDDSKQRPSTSKARTYQPDPFSRALFTSDMLSIMKDIDDSQIGLFTLNYPTPSGPRVPTRLQVQHPDSSIIASAVAKAQAGDPKWNTGDPQISRARATEATPLKNRRARPSTKSKAGWKEYDPEVYAEAALRYLDKYPTVRSLPKARAQAMSLLNRIDEARSKIEELQVQLQGASTQRPPSPKSQADEEKRNIIELEETAKALSTRRDELLAARRSIKPSTTPVQFSETDISDLEGESELESEAEIDEMIDPSANESVAPSSPTPRKPRTGAKKRRESRLPTRSGIPRVSAIAKSLSDDLISPPPAPKEIKPKPTRPSTLARFSLLSGAVGGMSYVQPEKEKEEIIEEEESYVEEETMMAEQDPLAHTEEEGADNEDSRDLDPDVTAQSEVSLDVDVTLKAREPAQRPPGRPSDDDDGRGTPKRTGKVRITSTVETIVAKIWAVLGDMLFPAHTGKTPLRAKETIALLQNILTLPSAPPSPSTQSTLASLNSELVLSTAATSASTQQVLTAYILLALLGSNLTASVLSSSTGAGGSGVPAVQQHAMLVQELKSVITTKMKASGFGTGVGGGERGLVDEKDVTRALYACVAKKLLMLDWSAGVQVVKFSV